ncbi:ribosomal protein S18 acetylase RimI-like enzyme [Agromyces hippuratus]|uniref:Ribosomal protein S18 acetylase RimI-like enzyme n=1 Tax=Agromyces hippuratus TaxID=286438 RepID=A0A852WS10_9MICO|nr:GNAT family N-acetyltransferase [Agromyces hippuratus]NYG20706.1 ribosomal protein S18 acetylase RimI-like enzyme [Agromyces hippuratus]
MPEIRPYRPADREQVARICLLTAAAGGDATGVYSDDALMPEVFALPYVEYAPELAFVVADGERVLGYVIGVADTAAFVEWWRREWAPGFAARHPSPGAPTGREPDFTEAQLLEAGTAPERMLIDELAEYPAHLHIDLLPELQGQGFGRRLIDTLRGALAARGVPAVHLGMDAANIGARAFYDRLGFHELPSSRVNSPLLGIATSQAGAAVSD